MQTTGTTEEQFKKEPAQFFGQKKPVSEWWEEKSKEAVTGIDWWYWWCDYPSEFWGVWGYIFWFDSAKSNKSIAWIQPAVVEQTWGHKDQQAAAEGGGGSLSNYFYI